jgi:hypothetical protein
MHQPKVRGETGRRVRFYMALGLVAAATLMLQIIETRIISVISWYHLAFFVISIAMFGLTAGAVFVYLRRDRFRPEQLSYDLTAATLAFALTTNLAILVQLTLVTGASPSLTSLVAWAEFALCLAVPFFFAGVVVSLFQAGNLSRIVEASLFKMEHSLIDGPGRREPAWRQPRRHSTPSKWSAICNATTTSVVFPLRAASASLSRT